ncbi:MAG: heme-binding domain-containing protein [Saprospiraceae bacterium]
MKQKIFLALGVIFIIAQFFQIDKTNPPAVAEQDYLQAVQPPAEVANLIKTACYDCHSHTTEYPWYTSVSPVNFWVKNHITHGREHLNFSTWTTYPADKAKHKLEECQEVLEDKEMPMLSYMIAHNEAWISAEERQLLADWFKGEVDGKR